MMKVFHLTSILFVFLPAAVFAQEPQTLIDSEVRHGGFGAPVFGITSINGEVAYFRGTRGAWVINFEETHTINLGLALYRTATNFEPVNWTAEDIPEPEMRTNYGGFEIEYVNQSDRLYHWSVQTLIGSGTVRYSGRDIELDNRSDSYFVIQPGVNMNLNITRWFRLSGGLGYRFTSGVNLEGTSNSDLSGLTSFFALRFGKF
jgi:hypothetical protein